MSESIVVTRGGVTVEATVDDVRRDVASMQKSIVAVLVGIALARGHLRLSDTVTSHLGDGWTGRTDVPTEADITLEHMLSMTSGLGDAMEFVAKPGERWDYNLVVYPLTKRVLSAAVGAPLGDITAAWLTTPLGMAQSAWEPRVWDGSLPDGWKPAFFYPDGAPMEAFVSTATDMARFGNAALGGCTGLGVDDEFRVRMTRASQALNPAYGLLWWVDTFAPGLPPDAYAALGAGEQCCIVIPSLEMVMARTRVATATDSGSPVSEFAARVLRDHATT